MEREEIERVERELDAILKLVQPEPTMQDKAREEALSKEPVSGGDKTTSEEYLTEEGTLEAYLFGDDSSEEMLRNMMRRINMRQINMRRISM